MKLWTAKELKDTNLGVPFLLEPIWPAEGIVLLHGKRGLGKTQLLLTIACCIAHNGSLFGRYPTRRSGSIVIVEADMSPLLMRERVVSLYQAGYDLPNVYITFPGYVNVATLGLESPLVKELNNLEPVMIVWEVLGAIFHGDTNADYSANIVYDQLRRLFPHSLHLVVHHDKKTTAEQHLLDSTELFRGSSAWIDRADAAVHLTPVPNNPQARLLRFTKLRTCPRQPSILISMQDGLLFKAKGKGGKWDFVESGP